MFLSKVLAFFKKQEVAFTQKDKIRNFLEKNEIVLKEELEQIAPNSYTQIISKLRKEGLNVQFTKAYEVEGGKEKTLAFYYI